MGKRIKIFSLPQFLKGISDLPFPLRTTPALLNCELLKYRQQLYIVITFSLFLEDI